MIDLETYLNETKQAKSLESQSANGCLLTPGISPDNQSTMKGPKPVTVLLVGESGAGKTNLKLTVRDYLEQTPIENVISTRKEEEKEYELRGKEKPETGSSQTKWCTFSLHSNPQFEATIIDTPGVHDPESKEKENLDQIAGFVDEIEFNAVILVMKTSTNRDYKSLKEAMKELTDRLSDENKKNIIVVFTGSRKRPGEDVLSVFKKLEVPCLAYTWMDNDMYMSGYDSQSTEDSDKLNFQKNHMRINQLLTVAANLKLHQGIQFAKECEKNNRNILKYQEIRMKLQNLNVKIEALEKWKTELFDPESPKRWSLKQDLQEGIDVKRIELIMRRQMNPLSRVICVECELAAGHSCMEGCTLTNQNDITICQDSQSLKLFVSYRAVYPSITITLSAGGVSTLASWLVYHAAVVAGLGGSGIGLVAGFGYYIWKCQHYVCRECHHSAAHHGITKKEYRLVPTKIFRNKIIADGEQDIEQLVKIAIAAIGEELQKLKNNQKNWQEENERHKKILNF